MRKEVEPAGAEICKSSAWLLSVWRAVPASARNLASVSIQVGRQVNPAIFVARGVLLGSAAGASAAVLPSNMKPRIAFSTACRVVVSTLGCASTGVANSELMASAPVITTRPTVVRTVLAVSIDLLSSQM